MKKLYTLGIALSMIAFGTQSMAQVKVQSSSTSHIVKAQMDEVPTARTVSMESSAKKTAPTPKDDGIVYFSEDFSNGMGGQLGENGAPDNGPWTVGEAQGALWFQTFPRTADGGYNPDLKILDGSNPLYLTKLAQWFSNDNDVVNSTTRDNGVMMMDMDRWNSYSTEENPLVIDPTLPQSTYMSSDSADATLISPEIDLTGVEFAALSFRQSIRVCCPSSSEIFRGLVYAEVSVDNQANWEKYELFSENDGEVNDVLDLEVVINISDVLQDAASTITLLLDD